LLLLGSGKGVGEIVGMLSIFDDDLHGAGKAGELAGAGARNYGDAQLIRAIAHCARVLQGERARVTVKSPADSFHGYIATETLGRIACGEHFAFARGFEIAMELFVDGHTTKGVLIEFERGVQRDDLHFEGTGGMLDHGSILLLR